MKSDQEPITGDNFGGCVLWINFDERTMELRPYDWFGGRPERGILLCFGPMSWRQQIRVSIQGRRHSSRDEAGDNAAPIPNRQIVSSFPDDLAWS